MRNPKFVLPVALSLASGFVSGCATYTRAEIDLVTQARRGVELVAQQDDQRDRAVAQLAQLRREKLDQAFDADVRERATQETLDPDWVIESRRAYAVAIDAYAKAQAANERSALVRRQNLASVNAALDRLQWMQSVRLKLDPLNNPESNEEEQP